jgi:hypothetical protein
LPIQSYHEIAQPSQSHGKEERKSKVKKLADQVLALSRNQKKKKKNEKKEILYSRLAEQLHSRRPFPVSAKHVVPQVFRKEFRPHSIT